MEPATLQIGAEQRDLIGQYLRTQVSRAASEEQETGRKSGLTKSINDAAGRLRSEVDSARKATLEQADSLRSRATTTLGKAAQCQETAVSLVHLLRRRGDLPGLDAPVSSRDTFDDPERALSHYFELAQGALGGLRASLAELAELERGAARLRLVLASVFVVMATGLLVHFWGPILALLLFPLLLAAAVSAFRLDHGVILLDRLMAYAAEKRAQASAKPWYSVARNYFGGLTSIRDSTDSISNPYIQSGTRAAATMYFSGSAAGVVAAASYALVAVVVGILVIGAILWIAAKLLENA